MLVSFSSQPAMSTSSFSFSPLSSSPLPDARDAPILQRIVTALVAFIPVCFVLGVIGSLRSEAAPVASAPGVTAAGSKMKTYIIFRRSGWDTAAALSQAGARSSEIGQKEMSERVRWIRSYVTDEGGGRVGTVCIYEAINDDAVREHARRAGLPCDVIVHVIDTVIINPDPVQQPKP
jgi:hypothetical protein